MPTEKNLTTIEKVIFLKSVDIFEHATVEQLGRIAGLVEEVHFEAGQIIYKEGDPGDALYVVLSGQVVLEKNGSTLRELKEKEAFGTLEVLDFHPRAATAKAIDQVRAQEARELRVNGRQPVLNIRGGACSSGRKIEPTNSGSNWRSWSDTT